MVYLYKKTIHGNPYYYLRISKSIKGKIIVKDVAYLGNNPSDIEIKLENLHAEYKKEIRKAYRNIKNFIQKEYYLKKIKELKLKKDTYLGDNLNEIEAIKLHFNNHFLKNDKKTIEETYKNFLVDFAFNTTSIEGNTITLKEADKLLKEALTPKNRTLREVYDLQNTEKVFFNLIDSKQELSHDFIIQIHDSLMENVDNRKGYRMHDLKIFKSHFKATPFFYIKIDIEILLKWYKKYKNKLHPLVLAALFHQKFEKIHPFSDGNGRTGRMLLNYILMKENYPPLIIRKSRREDYLDSLSIADKTDINNIEIKYYKDLIKYLVEELTYSYWNNFNI